MVLNLQLQTKRMQVLMVTLITVSIIMIDQAIKILVKTNMYLHESIRITDWWYILFTENKGMAFGMQFFDKIFLTGFRIIAVCAIIWYMARIIRRGVEWGYLVCLSLIMAGAAGNIIDCVFYGMIFSNPPAPMVAEFVPWGTGYDSLFYGRVVDMFYFPLVEWVWPSWIPFLGGEDFIFFSPIFNFADSAISVGVVAFILFYHRKLNS